MRIEQMRSAFLVLSILLAVATDCQRSIEPASDDASQAEGWSEDRVRVQQSLTNVFQVFITNGTGDSIRRLTHDVNNYMYPRFSPDGSRIGFTTDRVCMRTLRLSARGEGGSITASFPVLSSSMIWFSVVCAGYVPSEFTRDLA